MERKAVTSRREKNGVNQATSTKHHVWRDGIAWQPRIGRDWVGSVSLLTAQVNTYPVHLGPVPHSPWRGGWGLQKPDGLGPSCPYLGPFPLGSETKGRACRPGARWFLGTAALSSSDGIEESGLGTS